MEGGGAELNQRMSTKREVSVLFTSLNGMSMAWTNLRCQDKTWAEFSTLDMGVHLHHAPLSVQEKLPNLKWKTRPKQTLRSLPLAYALPI